MGVGASPSCGIATTVDLDGAIAAMAACDRDSLDPALVNDRVVGANVAAGEGMFIASSGAASLGGGSRCRSVSMTCSRSCEQLRSSTARVETVRSPRRR